MRLSILLLLLSSGCQKAGYQTSASDTSLAIDSQSLSGASSANCKSSAVVLDSQKSLIQGTSATSVGQSVSFQLDARLGCDQARAVSWKSGNEFVGYGPKIITEFKQAGIYTLTATVDEPVDQTVDQPMTQDGSASVEKITSQSGPVVMSLQLGVAGTSILIVGPQVGEMMQSYQMSLAIPAGTTLTSSEWNMGDGRAVVNSLAPVSVAYNSSGVYDISVRTVDSLSQERIVHHQMTVLPFQEGPNCAVNLLDIVGPTSATVGVSANYSLNIPNCLIPQVTSVNWIFGDGSANTQRQSTSHVFADVGSFTITAQIFTSSSTTRPYVTLRRDVSVEPAPASPPPIIVTIVTPPPVVANRCFNEGAERTTDGQIYSETVTCGLNGTKSTSYRDRSTEQCQLVGENSIWVETSKSKEPVKVGDCLGQSCRLITASGSEVLADTRSRVLYTTRTSVNSCELDKETRTCSNGVLSGSYLAIYPTCQNGCGDFGLHGTVKTAVTIGQVVSPVICQYGEPGVLNIYNQESDQTCNNGTVVNTNTHQAALRVAGHCPTYSWVGTDTYSTCSANCGGSQTRNFECRDDKGVLSPAERCSTPAPVESRICDANADAVRVTTSSTNTEDAGSSTTCPKDQIGVIVSHRDVTVVETVACIDHRVQIESRNSTATPWTSESYCKDFVAHRCSQDSLNNDQANGRYEWMKNCQASVPAIREFLQRFDNVHTQDFGLNDSVRHLYPTFMDSKTDSPWIAPTSSDESCNVPSSAYVATVCVSSCSTPEQQILAQAKGGSLHNHTFIESLTANLPVVGTLQSTSSMSSKDLAKTKVEQWVTELINTTHQILIFHMRSGGQLKITLNHPLLSQEGVMKLASDFKVGDSLVQLGGVKDPIVAIEPVVHFGKVYNLFVKSNDLKKNVVVINGYLSGTAFYQNEGAKFINRALLRNQLFRGAFPEKDAQ